MSDRLALALALSLLLGCSVDAGAQEWRTISGSRQYAGQDGLSVDVKYGAGRLRLAPAEPGLLYRTRLRYDARIFDPTVRYEDGRLRIAVEGRGVDLKNAEAGALDLHLGSDAPLRLDLGFGAGQAEIELGGLRIREALLATGASDTRIRFSEPNPERAERIEVSVGAAGLRVTGLGNANAERIILRGGVGDVTLGFGGQWRGDSDVEVKMGLGALTLLVPADIGVRIERSTLLSSFEASRFTRRDGAHISDNWDAARHRITVGLDAAFSSITIRWTEATAEES